MTLNAFRFLMLGLGPMALTACAEPGPAAADVSPPVSVLGIDLGNSARVRLVAALAGEGEGYGRTEPGATPTAHGSMPGMSHGSMGGMQMDHGSMPGMSHESRERPTTGHGSTPGMSHGHDSMAGMKMADSGHAHAQGTGAVNSVDAAAHKINMSHGPIPTIGWPAMTMDFAVAPSVDLRAVQPGTRINFTIEQGQGGMYVIQSIAPAGRWR